MKKPSSGKNNFGGALIALGIFLIFYAWSMDVTVYSNIINLGLLDDRRNILLMGLFFIGIGIFLFTSGLKQPANILVEPAPENPPCQRDLSLPPYKIWLIARYGIKKNDVLNSFVCQEQIFSTVDRALEYAHSLEIRKFDEQRILDQQQKEKIEKISITNAEALRASRELRKQQHEAFVSFVRKHKFKLIGATATIISIFASINIYEKFLFKKYFEAGVALSEAEDAHKAANLRWFAARDAAAKKLEKDELQRIEINVEMSSDRADFDARVINNSRYHVNEIEGFLSLYSKGLAFPYNTTRIKCCSSAIPPGGSELIRGAIDWSYAWSGLEMRNFAEKNGIKLTRREDGMIIFPLDKTARLGSASIQLLSDESHDQTNPKTPALRKVDFAAEAEKLPEVLALYDSRGASIIERRRREFAEAKVDWYSWNNVPSDFDSAVD